MPYNFNNDYHDEDMFDAILGDKMPQNTGAMSSAPPSMVSKSKVIQSAISKPVAEEAPISTPMIEKPVTIPEPVLAKLEATQPDLVAKYREKMATADQGVKDAQDKQDMGNYGNIAAKLATDYGNSQKDDTIYHNSWSKMGNAPQIEKAERKEYDPSMVDKMGQQGVDRAKANRAQSENDFMTGEKLADLQTSRGDAQRSREETARLKDPNSAESEAARQSLMQMAPKFATGKDFSKLSAAQIEKIAPQAFQASQQMASQEFSAGESGKSRAFQAGENEKDRTYKTNKEAAEATKKVAEANSESGRFKQLPEDKQKTITGLASKNAEKESIANQIDSMLAEADKATDKNVKLGIYRQMGKVLNSTEGKDAVGADEAKRLMAMLEFAPLGNLFSSEPMHSPGRDYEGFADQAKATSAGVRNAIKANNTVIDHMLGRSPETAGASGSFDWDAEDKRRGK